MEIKIKDPILEPYYIIKSPYDYVIAETVIPKEKYTEEGGKPYIKYRSAHTSIGSCLAKIIALKNPEKEEYNSLIEYIKEIKDLNEKMVQLIQSVGI